MSRVLPEIDFRHLSEAHSERPEFVTLYLNTPDRQFDRTFIENRQNDILKAMISHPALKKKFLDEVDRIVLEVQNRGLAGESIAVFACGAQDFFLFLELPVAFESDMLVLDTSPYIKPLAFMYEEYEHFLVVMVDSSNGVIHSVAGNIKGTDSIHKDIMKHHKKGGWSQMRYQRIREGNILHLYKEIAEKTAAIVKEEKVKRIVLAGPKEAKKNFFEELPKQVQDMVIGYADVSMKASYEEILDEAYEIFFKEEQKQEAEKMELLREEIFKGGLAAIGPNASMKALKNGRVRILLVDPETRGGGWKCEHCGIWKTGVKKNCPECSREVFQVDVYEEAIEEAQKMDSEVEFVKSDAFLQSIGGMAALLRW